MYDFPLLQALEHYRAQDYSRFHMPGHKGRFPLPFPLDHGLLPYDLTEVEGTDSLFEADGPLARLEERYASLYGTHRTVLSAGGSTLCIQAMLRLVGQPGGRVIAGRSIHGAAVNAMALLGLEPVWVYPRRTTTSGQEERLVGPILPQAVEEALDLAPDACAVYLTSPDYFGVLSPIREIAKLCHSRGVPLLVDNAHGAHLKFLSNGQGRSLHPIDQGADLCCDSLHKTLPALTGAALLHCGNPAYSPTLKEAMGLFGSTSPSYLILLSCDWTAGFLSQEGPRQLEETVDRCRSIRALARERGLYPPEQCDPMRITLPLSGTGWSREEFRALLRKCHIMEEFLGENGCVLLASPLLRDRDYLRLETLLREFVPRPAPATPYPLLHPRRVMGLRQAMLAPREEILVEEAAGRIAAQVKSPCPPGVPLVMPGEILQKESIQILKRYGICRLSVIK